MGGSVLRMVKTTKNEPCGASAYGLDSLVAASLPIHSVFLKAPSRRMDGAPTQGWTMGQFRHEQVLDLLAQMADNTRRMGTLKIGEVVPVGGAAPEWMCPWSPGAPALAWTMSHESFFALVRCVPSLIDPSYSYVELVGGGAWGVPSNARLFERLTTRATDFHHGGAFSTSEEGHCYGLRNTITGQLLWEENASAAYSYISATLIGLGVAARTIATELLATVGGTIFDSEDTEAGLRLLWSVSRRHQ